LRLSNCKSRLLLCNGMSWFLPCLLDGSRPSFLFGRCHDFKIPNAGVSYMISYPFAIGMID